MRHGPEGLYVCLVDPLNPQTVEDLRFALGQDIHVLVAPDTRFPNASMSSMEANPPPCPT
ncbi:MAG: hypothetical protein ACLSUW_01970 [Akkermansia sp.]